MVDNGFVYNGFLWVPVHCMDYDGYTTAAVGGQQSRPEDFYQAYYSHNTEMPVYDEPVDTLDCTGCNKVVWKMSFQPMAWGQYVFPFEDEQESHHVDPIRCQPLEEQGINRDCERLRELFWDIGKMDLKIEKGMEG